MKRPWLIAFLLFAILSAWLFKKKIMPTMTRAEFKKKFLEQTAGLDTGGIPLLILLAVAAYESGDGNGRYAREANNLFSITAGSTWTGPVLKNLTGSYTFRKYAGWRDSVADFVRLMGISRYKTALEYARGGNLAAFAAELQRAGYGDPGKTTYGAELVARAASYNKLA